MRINSLIVFLFVISTVVTEETQRTCRQSLMLSLKAIFEENANDVCVSLPLYILIQFLTLVSTLQTMDELKTLLSPMIVEVLNQQVCRIRWFWVDYFQTRLTYRISSANVKLDLLDQSGLLDLLE